MVGSRDFTPILDNIYAIFFLKILPAYAYKKRVKNNTKSFDIPAHLSSEEWYPESEGILRMT